MEYSLWMDLQKCHFLGSSMTCITISIKKLSLNENALRRGSSEGRAPPFSAKPNEFYRVCAHSRPSLASFSV